MTDYIPEMKKLYKEEIVPQLQKDLGIANAMAVPRIEKIVVNAGLGLAKEKTALWEQAARDLAMITGQRPVARKARKSVAGFKIRRGMPIGQMVTLRGSRMYDFLSRFLNIAVPRMRDFRGFIKDALDDQGNFSFGFPEHNVFPEVVLADKELTFSLQVTIVMTAKNKEKGQKLLEKFGFPFVRE